MGDEEDNSQGSHTERGRADGVHGAHAARLGTTVYGKVEGDLLPEEHTHADVGQLLRVLGCASSLGLLRALGIIAGFAGATFLVVAIWMLAAMVVAVRQALDYTSTWRALGVVAIGRIVQVIACVPS